MSSLHNCACAIFICFQAISGEGDFVIATGSSGAEDVQIKIWTPTKVIIVTPVVLKFVFICITRRSFPLRLHALSTKVVFRFGRC